MIHGNSCEKMKNEKLNLFCIVYSRTEDGINFCGSDRKARGSGYSVEVKPQNGNVAMVHIKPTRTAKVLLFLCSVSFLPKNQLFPCSFVPQ